MKASQSQAIAEYRRRLGDRGISRYEVRGLDADKELVRAVARCLAAGDAAADRLRAELAREMAAESPRRGSILASLRRSPLVGADLRVKREVSHGREIDL